MSGKQIVIIMMILALAGTIDAARTSSSYQVPKDVLASGGVAASSAAYQAPINIVGQTLVGSASSARYRNLGGYIPAETGEEVILAPPESHVVPFTTSQITAPTVDVVYTASSEMGSVQYVELYYRRNVGDWIAYGGQHATSPIGFDTSLTGGDGYYEFYTVATDNHGLREATPATADAALSVITYFTGPRIYVDASVSISGDGSSWAQAKKTIGEAVALALDGDEIWVADGVYAESFWMKSGIAIYGGFAGGETDWAERNVVANVATIDATDQNDGVVFQGVNNSRIDGLTITGAYNQNIRCAWLPVDDTVVIANCTVTNATFGINCWTLAEPFILDSTFTNNIEGARSTNGAHPVFIDCTLTSNSSSGVYCGEGSVDLTDCIITNNAIGGIHTVNLTSSTFTNCLIAWNGTSGGVNCGFNSSPTIIDCEISYNREEGIGCTDNSSPEIINCRITGNGTFGMWLYRSAPTFINTTIIGNLMHGAFISSSEPEFDSCTIAGNYKVGVHCTSSTPTLSNCVISGNGESGIWAAESSGLRVINCTIADNTLHGVQSYLSPAPSVANSIFTGNGEFGVHEESAELNPEIAYCLFERNAAGDYYDFDTGVYTGAANINSELANVSDCVDGDPLFAMGPTGSWTSALGYNPATSRTILIDSSASFNPGELAGFLINVNTSQSLQTLITTNTATMIEVIGNAAEYAAPGDIYQIIDYHIQDASAALDRGSLDFAPYFDFDGTPRPGDNGLTDIGADEHATPSEAARNAILGFTDPPSIDTMDANGDGIVDIADIIFMINDE